MQAVKSKLQSLKAKLDETTKGAEEAEEELAATNAKADECEEKVNENINNFYFSF